MKKVLVLFVLMLGLMSSVYASSVNVQINGEIIDFTDNTGAKVEAQIVNGRTMVPFRKIFNTLGVTDDNILWNGEEKSIEAKKDNIIIKLQISNNIASKIIDGVESKITLDSAPIISNNRTLVPLRFIAESLGKTVGWDATNRTAVIIDFEYFLTALKNKSSSLYEFLIKDTSNTNLTITRSYYDLYDTSQNDTAVVNASIIESKLNSIITDSVTVKFSGTNELMQEINEEGWGEIQFENVYAEDYFITKALNDGLKKVYGTDQMKFKYEALDCIGNYDLELVDGVKLFSGINENQISIYTFNDLKNEFNALLKLFSVNSNTLSTGTIASNDIEINYFNFIFYSFIIFIY